MFHGDDRFVPACVRPIIRCITRLHLTAQWGKKEDFGGLSRPLRRRRVRGRERKIIKVKATMMSVSRGKMVSHRRCAYNTTSTLHCCSVYFFHSRPAASLPATRHDDKEKLLLREQLVPTNIFECPAAEVESTLGMNLNRSINR